MLAALQHSWQGIWHRVLAVALLVAWSGLGPGGAATAEPPKMSEAEAREQLQDLRSRIQGVQARLETERSERSDEEKRIEELDREVAGLASRLRDTRQEQESVRGAIADLDDRLGRVRAQIIAHQARVARLVRAAYIMGRQSKAKLVLNQQDPAVLNRMLGYHDYVMAARADAIAEIDAWASEIETLTAEQRDKQDRLESLAQKYQAERRALQARRREREAALEAVSARIVSSESELSGLRENENRLQQVLRELEQYLRQSSRQIAKGAFRSMRGKLRLPVSAPIAAGYGQIRSTGVRWDGIMFRPEVGADVKAIYEGRVVFADWLRGFGLLLIIDHGDGFMSLYSHNESLFKELGDWVDTEEVVATVGTSGGLDRAGLYFEIRHDGEPQNPLSWCQRA